MPYTELPEPPQVSPVSPDQYGEKPLPDPSTVSPLSTTGNPHRPWQAFSAYRSEGRRDGVGSSHLSEYCYDERAHENDESSRYGEEEPDLAAQLRLSARLTLGEVPLTPDDSVSQTASPYRASRASRASHRSRSQPGAKNQSQQGWEGQRTESLPRQSERGTLERRDFGGGSSASSSSVRAVRSSDGRGRGDGGGGGGVEVVRTKDGRLALARKPRRFFGYKLRIG
ncbi:uncharacterized protein JN550_001471 [Neoarthrinium moseri]|uniref:uncharacterized protein n=1 Tax=Neoarthrinium moseri TaxID=1658444 RepID=UPI001FDE53D2|nr:uncharacterized protein JN550_001471 [Neoarthrinium moseri]KAI1875975.1 hypothetical protein JN550_001471 [Neoarthrinium moseri]